MSSNFDFLDSHDQLLVRLALTAEQCFAADPNTTLMKMRQPGNEAAHDITSSNHRDALKALQIGHALAVWFHLQFGGERAKGFKARAFVKPDDPSDRVRALQEKLREQELRGRDTADRLQQAEAVRKRAATMAAESKVWAPRPFGASWCCKTPTTNPPNSC